MIAPTGAPETELRFEHNAKGIWVYLPSVPHGPYFVERWWIDRARCAARVGDLRNEEKIARNIAIGIRIGSFPL